MATMKDIMKIPPGKKRMKALAAMKKAEAKSKKDTRTIGDIAPVAPKSAKKTATDGTKREKENRKKTGPGGEDLDFRYFKRSK